MMFLNGTITAYHAQIRVVQWYLACRVHATNRTAIETRASARGSMATSSRKTTTLLLYFQQILLHLFSPLGIQSTVASPACDTEAEYQTRPWSMRCPSSLSSGHRYFNETPIGAAQPVGTMCNILRYMCPLSELVSFTTSYTFKADPCLGCPQYSSSKSLTSQNNERRTFARNDCMGTMPATCV